MVVWHKTGHLKCQRQHLTEGMDGRDGGGGRGRRRGRGRERRDADVKLVARQIKREGKKLEYRRAGGGAVGGRERLVATVTQQQR